MKHFFVFVERLSRGTRLLLSVAFGLAVFLLVKAPGETGIAFLYGWICFAATSLFLSWITILLRHPKQTAKIAKEQDENLWTVFLLVVSASFISLFAVLLLLRSQPTASKAGLSLHIVLSLVSIVLSWFLIHSLFTIRYAHLYYDRPQSQQEQTEHAGGLQFPGDEPPDFLDFAYFAFILAMTFQTADVNITRRRIRRLALIHGLLSFVYNTTIIALIINIVSGLIGSK